MCTHTYVHVCAHIHIQKYVHTHTHIYIYIYIYIYTCIHIDTRCHHKVSRLKLWIFYNLNEEMSKAGQFIL